MPDLDQRGESVREERQPRAPMLSSVTHLVVPCVPALHFGAPSAEVSDPDGRSERPCREPGHPPAAALGPGRSEAAPWFVQHPVAVHDASERVGISVL